LHSVLDQNYEHLEYVVMDGGSEDESVDILRRHEGRLASWVSEADNGQAHAINKGIAASTGEIVAYINSDDFYLPGTFEEVAGQFADPDVLWVAGGCRYEHADGTIETVYRPTIPSGSRASWLRQIWYAPQASSFWRRSVFERYGSLREDLTYVFDTEFGLRLALAGVLPRISDRLLAVRFLHDEAKSAEKLRFDREWEEVLPGLQAQLTTRDHLSDVGLRVVGKAHRTVRRLKPST
jgi:glycosyltransferase involved in cell wall biosynthesis